MLRFLLLAAAALSQGALAAEFSVSPIRVDLGRGVRSAVVNIANDDQRPLRMQLSLAEWTQDAEGKDVYVDSDALVYYPRLMTVEPKDKRIVRVGLKAAAEAVEKTYRLFIDELPEIAAPEARAAASGLTFTIRFALPLFVPPAEPRLEGRIESMRLRDGQLEIAVRNAGNVSFRIHAVAASSGKFKSEAGGWYLLAGATRVHRVDIPAAECRRMRRLEVTVKADKLSLQGGLDVEAGMCPR